MLARVLGVPGTHGISGHHVWHPRIFEVLRTNWHSHALLYRTNGTLSFKFLTQALTIFKGIPGWSWGSLIIQRPVFESSSRKYFANNKETCSYMSNHGTLSYDQNSGSFVHPIKLPSKYMNKHGKQCANKKVLC